MQELIFKNGQAGITKASVSVIFDNTDPDNCPVGYENCREITVSRQVVIGGGGKNKYFINGKTVLTKKVIDLFCSIQMNVNNPNFLIMQGRITKVLNMKPMEVWVLWHIFRVISLISLQFCPELNEFRSILFRFYPWLKKPPVPVYTKPNESTPQNSSKRKTVNWRKWNR